MKSILSTLTALFFAASLFAQVPEGISYQAIAFNASGGAVVNANVGIRISILDGSVTGTSVYTETHTRGTNTQGLFSLSIGMGTPTLGTFAAVDWATGSKFLKVEIDPAGGTNYTSVGANQLMSVPYALMAKEINASNIVGQIEKDSVGVGALTDYSAYAFANGQWYSQSLNGLGKQIVASQHKIGVLSQYNAYVFSGNQWHSQSLNGTYRKIIGHHGCFIATSQYNAYAFQNNTWTSVSLNGIFVEAVTKNGLSGVLSDYSCYAFNNGQWYPQSLNGTAVDISVNGENIIVISRYSAYVFNRNTNQWVQQSLNGTFRRFTR